MEKYFNVHLEFDHDRFFNAIEHEISKKAKGFVCVVDANVLAMAQKSSAYCQVLNSSFINTCDGSSIATMASWLYKKRFFALNGPDIFEYYIEKPYNHLLLGSTEDVVNKIRQKLLLRGMSSQNLFTETLPFCTTDEFDYKNIAEKVNSLKPDIIWVCLGAPKQEFFMSKLLPHIDSGIMFGIGAAFNFYIGTLSIPTFKIGSLRFIWLTRLLKEPFKLSKRIWQITLIFPGMFLREYLIKK